MRLSSARTSWASSQFRAKWTAAPLRRAYATEGLDMSGNFGTKASLGDLDPVIVSAVRTPVTGFGGSLASVPATKLGAVAISGAVDRAGIASGEVCEVIMGNVLSAGIGQAPARQAALFAGLPNTVICTTINKVCASGMKAIMLGAQSIMLGTQTCVVAGGFESMSNVPYYLPQARAGHRYGHVQAIDGIVKDGLWDVYNDFHMGNCAEDCAAKMGISREEQDAFALESYRRAIEASKAGLFDAEIVGVSVPQRGKEDLWVEADEEPFNLKIDKVPTIKSAFMKDGTVTAANASKLNDGAAAVVIMSAAEANKEEHTPLARIVGFADAEQQPIEFTTTPAKAIPKALKMAGIDIEEVGAWEINEAFSVVSLANQRLLKIDSEKLNIRGGAVALGHPIGASGARIVTTLVHTLLQDGIRYGCASICNGGGGASAIVIENLQLERAGAEDSE